jgi:thermostable 8-oxoguanine DNA glycosylase
MELSLSLEDFKNARQLYEEERIQPLSSENMFKAGLYCILSAADSYRKLKILHAELLQKGLDTSESILSRKQSLRSVLRKSRFQNTKVSRVLGFAAWWPDAQLPYEIIEDVTQGKNNEFELRNRLAEEAPGMGYKCASLFMGMCGYENVVPIDLWALRFLAAHGYEVKIPDFETIGGAKRREFLEYERVFSEIIRKYEVSPAVAHRALWTKYSTWKKRS